MATEQKPSPWGSPNAGRQQRKEKILESLNKLGNRDTQRTAFEELQAMIQDLNEDGLLVLVSSICQSGKEHKPLARKEGIRLFCELSGEDCPVNHLVLAHPHLTKILKFLRACVQDSDAGVRETAGEVFGTLAANWTIYHKTTIHGELTNVFVKTILESLSDPKKEVQVAAGVALAQIAEYMAPVTRDTAKELFKFLKNTHFKGGAQLVASLCSLDNQEPKGLMKGSRNVFKPILGSLIGSPTSSSGNGAGLLSFLSSKEWPLRKASAETLNGLAILYGPELKDIKSMGNVGNLIDRCKKTLSAARFDKVKPVRESLQHACTAFTILEGYMESDEQMDWVEFWKKGMKNSHPGCNPGASISSGHAPAKPRFDETQKAGYVARFKKAATVDDVIAAPSLPPEGPDSVCNNSEADSEQRAPSTLDGAMRDIEGEIVVPEEQWVLMMERMDAMERQQNRLFEMIEALGTRIDTSALNLEGEISSMKYEMDSVQKNLSSISSQRAVSVPNSRNHSASPDMFMHLQGREPQAYNQLRESYDPSKSCSPAPADLDSAYSEALSIPNNELQLLRLIQKTGAVFPELSFSTLNNLITAFHQFLWEGRAVGRILPWFWQLIEPQNAHLAEAVDQINRIKIVGILNDLKEDVREEDRSQIQSMESSLRTVWGMSSAKSRTGQFSHKRSTGSSAPTNSNFEKPSRRSSGNSTKQDRQHWAQSSSQGLEQLQERLNVMNQGLRVQQ